MLTVDERLSKIENDIKSLTVLLNKFSNKIDEQILAIVNQLDSNGNPVQVETLKHPIRQPKPKPVYERNFSTSFSQHLNVSIDSSEATDLRLRLKTAFTTFNGKTQHLQYPSNNKHLVERYGISRENEKFFWTYGPTQYTGASAANHIHVALVDKNNEIIRPLDEEIYYLVRWDDKQKLVRLRNEHGFGSFNMARTNYYPDKGEQGPYSVAIVDSSLNVISEVVSGFGFPNGHKVAPFLFFQEI